MKYLSNFINECFRFYTPAPGTLVREAVKDHFLGEFLIKKGTNLFALFNIDCVNPNIVKDQDKFNPDRWDDALMKNLPSYSFTPFSAGPRNCIGK